MNIKRIPMAFGTVIAVAAPLVAVISCGNAVTGNGDKHSQDNELAPKGYHWVDVPHGDHTHHILLKVGVDPKTIYAGHDPDEVWEDGTHTIPADAFAGMHIEGIEQLKSIEIIKANAFLNADFTDFTATKLTNLLNNVKTIEAGAFNGAKLPHGFDIDAIKNKVHNQNIFVKAIVS